MSMESASQSSLTNPGRALRAAPLPSDLHSGGSALTLPARKVNRAVAKALSPMTTVEKRSAMLAQLDRAATGSARQGLGVPGADALMRADGLITQLVMVGDFSIFEVYVADDGSIEITASTPERFVTIDIAPASARASVVVQDSTGATLWAASNATDAELVRQVERAA